MEAIIVGLKKVPGATRVKSLDHIELRVSTQECLPVHRDVTEGTH